MEQFNRILAAFLILVVAVGISLFVFSRLGILSRIFPSNKPGVTTNATTQTTSPTPTQTPTLTPQAQTGILGWFSQFGKAQNTPTPTPTTRPLPTQAQTQTPPTIITQTPQFIEVTPSSNITIVPYGSVSSPTYPASGVETVIIPLFGSLFLLGTYLRRLS